MRLNNKQPQPAGDVSFEFVQTLAADLSAGRIDLPSFPEIALRVRRILSDPEATLDQVVRVVGSEPALAARLLRIANSASLNKSGKSVSDLRTAINRMGYAMVRSAAMSFAMAQMRSNRRLDGVKSHLDELWERSALVAALAFVLARSCTRINPDEAMLTGMLHGIGQLYVLTRAADHPELFAAPGALNEIMERWHAEIGKAILENWGFADAMVQAIANQQQYDREGEESADLSDVIVVAILLASFSQDSIGVEVMLRDMPAASRLGLDPQRIAGVLRQFDAEVGALRKVLGS